MRKDTGKNIQPDTALIGSCIKKDRTAFKQLVTMYQQYAYNLAFKILLEEEDAKDVVQETFIRIWNHIDNYRKEILFTTWMYRIVTNLCYDKLKSFKRKNHVSLHDAAGQGINLTNETEHNADSAENHEMIKQIRRLSRGLTTKQRMVFILRDIQGHSVKEVSEVLNMSEGAVKTNLYLARMFIREEFYKSENTGRIVR
ncbi:MAG: RNA polymerase sigma factor [Bacteroidales bacterium]|nr:RNA polymerase sigma factor [Bacteroidales bacterium]